MATLQDVVDRIKESHGENQSRFQDIRDGQDETIRIQNATLSTLRTMLDIQADALTDAREAAREAARVKGGDDDESWRILFGIGSPRNRDSALS